ncbi:hypothetical protein PZ938_05615 [Luteipulveratus sp. YIM 133132]|uniref:hypothetical protein n=1 Tax=Luteipulveratus flavus TaxID=3031728 RepID=UPI0023AF5A51|nr:hypothetical protein [Luteipulveratus sp. YIM 133132]MDE9365079.1 hypothetical protein [Luteipulveratus sp. YIM 133132]
MYAIAPGSVAGTAVPPGSLLGFGITGVHHLRGGVRSELPEAASRDFQAAMLEETGVPFRREELLTRPGNSYGRLAVSALEPLARDHDLDLVVVAYAVPDYFAARLPTTEIIQAHPRVRAAFGVADMGVVAPFQALELAELFATRHGYERVAVVALDQVTLPYAVRAEPYQVPRTDAAVAVVLERTADPRTGLAQRHGVARGFGAAQRSAVSEVLDRLCSAAGVQPVRVVVGAGVDPAWMPDVAAQVVRAQHGAPCTGVWAYLAATVEEPVVVLEADPALGAVHGLIALPGAGGEPAP